MVEIVREYKTKNGRLSCGKQSSPERRSNKNVSTAKFLAYTKKGNSKVVLPLGFHEVFATIKYEDATEFHKERTIVQYYPHGLIVSDEEFALITNTRNEIIARHN